VYTSLIYKGPGVVREIVKGLEERLRKDGFSRIADAVGADHR
jgi:dihydroorotate dehydrogenase